MAAAAVYWVKKRKKQEATEWEIFKEQYKASDLPLITETSQQTSSLPYDENLAEKIKAAVKEEMKNHFPKDSSQEKGYRFEKYVVEKFDSTYFKLQEWRSDKYHEGIYADTNKLPDLEYNFKTNRHDCKIGIECKWRAKFNNNKIEVASEKNLENYWKYSVDSRIPVFIILGLGGKPENPENLYIIPLDKIPRPELYRNQLNEYKRYSVKGNFFFNADKGILE